MPYIIRHDLDDNIRSEICFGPAKLTIYPTLPEAEQACAQCQNEAIAAEVDGDNRYPASGYRVALVSDTFKF